MRVLFSCNPLLGHLHPLLPLARAVRDADHSVAFLTGSELEAAVTSDGFEMLAAGPEFSTLVEEALTRYPDSALTTPDGQQQFGFERLFSEVRVGSTRADGARLAGEFAPDLVVNEVADFLGPLLAAEREVPNATAGIGLVLRADWLAAAASGVASAWRAAGLDAPDDAGLYRSLYLSQVPPSLQRAMPAAPMVSDLRPVAFGDGSTLPADLDHIGRRRALVYVTFGTLFGDVDLLRSIIEGVSRLDIDVVATVGFAVDPASVDPLRQNVIVRQFLPQGALLERCDLVVTHGGSGSVLGPLGSGVPLLVVPVGADQQENAVQVARAGVGRVIDAADVTSELIHEASRSILDDADMRHAARAVAIEIQAMPSPADVVPLLEALVT